MGEGVQGKGEKMPTGVGRDGLDGEGYSFDWDVSNMTIVQPTSSGNFLPLAGGRIA